MRDIIIGTVISGTMRNEDLIPTFIAEILYYDPNNNLAQRIDEKLNDTYDFNSEEAHYDLEDLFEELNEFAEPYIYFGAHPGDGSDYGFWVEFDDGIIVSDTSEVPQDYVGYVLHVNDHGNLTLYDCNGAEQMDELWQATMG